MNAQNVNLKINADHYEGKKVYIWLEDDFISKHKSLIAEQIVVDKQCSFTISVSNISKIRIGIEYQYGSMFVEPGANYELSFPKHNVKDNRSFAWNTKVMLSFIGLEENDINADIMNFNGDLDQFFSDMLENRSPSDQVQQDTVVYQAGLIKNFSQRDNLGKYNEYKNTWDSIYAKDNENVFFYNYRQYAGASISYSLGEKKSTLYDEYIRNKQIQYNNPEYIRFFKDFYQNYFDVYSLYPLSLKFEDAFRSTQPKEALFELVKQDSMTGDSQMQELIFLKGLYDYAMKNTANDSIIINIINDLSIESTYHEHRLVATNMFKKLTHGLKGSPFPDVNFISYTGDSLSLSDFKGQMIYLQIFASWSSTSMAELQLMDILHSKYASRITFVSLSIDSEMEELSAFVKENRQFNWEIGWVGEHPEFMEYLEIYDLPLFYLIDNKFMVYSWPALWPSTGVEKTFYDMELKEKEEKKFRFWENQTKNSKREE